MSSLYIHIPFCPRICPYCDFLKLCYFPDWGKRYCAKLIEEIRALPGLFDTIYLGGGTPTCLGNEDLDRVLSACQAHLAAGGEFSIEGNPESFGKSLCALLSLHGVNRVSIGAQSANPKSLKTLGRTHSFGDVKRAIANLHQAGIDNLNLDLIYALPEESDAEAEKDALCFARLPIAHISAYSLILEENSVYGRKGVKEADEDTQARQFRLIKNALEGLSFAQYEVSSFAKPGYQCRHNLNYWQDGFYLALGIGAAGYDEKGHYKNRIGMFDYFDSGSVREYEEEGKQDKIETFLLTNLRLVQGFSQAEFIGRFGEEEWGKLKRKAQKDIDLGLLTILEGRVSCTPRGLMLLDSVLLDLF